MFILGIIIGILISILVVLMLIFFRSQIEQKVKVIEKQVYNAGPRPKGAIIMPNDEADDIREKIIAENRKKGLDTNIKDLL